MSSVPTVLLRYRDHQDFEAARDQLHALGPAAMREVLAAAHDPAWADALPLLVMALSDVLYPPALSSMRQWMEHDDVEGIALPAASALDRTAGGRFGVDAYWSGDWSGIEDTFAALARWWDEGNACPTSEAAWLAERLAKRTAQQQAVPPPSPALSAADQAELRPILIAMVQGFRALDPRVQHRLEHRAVARVLPIWTRFAPHDARPAEALAVVGRYLRGEASEDALADARQHALACTEQANAAAAWNSIHQAWMRPNAKAAANVAQAIAYLCSPEPGNRLQGLHFARDAVEWSGAGGLAVWDELQWQHEQVKGAG